MSELYHYGVQGMKWGVRHDKRASLQKKIAKQNSVIAKNQQKFDKATVKYSTKVSANRKKENSYRTDAVNSRKRANSLLTSKSKAEKLRVKANELDQKADQYKVKADKVQNKIDKPRAKMEKAQAKINLYNKKLSDIDTKTVNAGKDYIDNKNKSNKNQKK